MALCQLFGIRGGLGMEICLDRNARYWSTPGGSRHRRPSSDRLTPFHLPISSLLPSHQKIFPHPTKKSPIPPKILSHPTKKTPITAKNLPTLPGRTFSIQPEVGRHASISSVSSHHVLSGFQFTRKLRLPPNSHPFQLTLKLVLLTGKCMAGRVFALQDLERGAFQGKFRG